MTISVRPDKDQNFHHTDLSQSNREKSMTLIQKNKVKWLELLILKIS